ncbi:biosynthetic arginine decarboxylase [Halofilum ochraceum]|uniref:biosynthetic arginine decarboxylase n=1 Tax=Halofilum ochraceum TaxID=1611323 RepID=UPI0008D9C933|nr:biosynthetic arginine decarboxylase [Halofilum ochraceum]
MTDWTLDEARHVYNVAHWGAGYFDVDAAGRSVVYPRRDGRPVVLAELADEARAAALPLPVLVRFVDILHDRVDTLCDAFEGARQRHGYGGAYTAVYPIKVNQQRSVVEHIKRPDDPRVGLEAGSKPELMAVLALMEARNGAVICNGYKDREYIRLALIGVRLGLRVRIVVEQPSEVGLVAEEAARLGVEPSLGVRVRLASIGHGRWQNTGGEKAKFGLSAQQVIDIVEHLRERGALHWLQLLHFHMGSQVANLRDIAAGMTEAARYYAELISLGAPLEAVDVGGGLAVDYDGSNSRADFSMNYAIERYADCVVGELARVCNERGLVHPAIYTEAGRAMSAHHAVLITDVIDTEPVPAATPAAPDPEAVVPMHDLWSLYSDPPGSMAERYQDAGRALAEVHALYTEGRLRLAERAAADRLFLAICHDTRDRLVRRPYRDAELRSTLQERLATKYFCNFSVFQSIPDVWGIGQLFPIMPLTRLDEPPDTDAILEDLTCDSDGHVEEYVHGDGIFKTLPLHAIRPGEDYLLGVFLVGAYQEILGDLHNLFGDTHSVNVELTEDGGWRLVDPERGDRVDELLRYVHFDPDTLLARFREKMSRTDLDKEQRASLLRELEDGLSAYTYLQGRENHE